jgi:DNA-binding NarL/FixJ family response regulator
MRCAGIAATNAEARALLVTTQPDVLLTDVRLPDGDGIDAARGLLRLQPDLRILVLTAYIDAQLAGRVASVGGCGIIPKESSIATLLAALRRASAGEMTLERSVLSALVDHAQPARQPAAPATGLTERESEVLLWLGRGLDPQTIARRLGISVHTCRGHVKSILAKLQAHSQLEAVVKAIRLGLITDGDSSS